MKYRNKQEQVNHELEQFLTTLRSLIPRYSELVGKQELSEEELTELGELEYFLIEVNARISDLKMVLDHDLFGLSLDRYYQLKEKARNGDVSAKLKMDRMRETFNESFRMKSVIYWN